ncbi:hypothetical protein DOTSEDRAFT_72962 [Dothistroma septosporum NZE10]|uniref:Uncharacterized protein n=1 Tax=Dothistroma septosporum (strain NZE10 / CBS 128990) TaxID=675120 RepID=N1PI19_DOTSN|nr:hypothetical protein DOTSEDRAFT_72962 [Dothistroma septosporum NZE10]
MATLDLPNDIRVSLYLADPSVRGITARSEPVSSSTSNATTPCPRTTIGPHQILLPKTPFIVIATFLSLTTLFSLIALALLLYRQFSRARQLERAKTWGRQSKFYESRGKRISLMRKEVDDSFSRQYSGVLATVHENPEMGSDSPVEICERDPRVWELADGGGSGKYGKVTGLREKEEEERRRSLFFCRDLGVWMPKR